MNLSLLRQKRIDIRNMVATKKGTVARAFFSKGGF